ncbi:hypothetical protein [Telluribacter sp. SYSU D00476]|uniref:hypothetical protein n=1 Tax=Telluribacter sp. SYSU D00476 TaxID=2811430 RepID=UPI001FF6D0E9|nr:hypothetical protein [Telluribacter sp. SYSU D00476]
MRKIVCLFILAIWLPVELMAQPNPIEVYQVTVVTNFGRRFSGYLYDITSTQLVYAGTPTSMKVGAGIGQIPLRDIRRVNVYGGKKRAGAIEGAIIGAAGVTFLALKSLQKSPLRSPVITGITLMLAAGGGAAFGSFVGAVGSNMGRRGFRVSNKDGDESFLRSQLTPFTYTYQMNRSQSNPDQYYMKEPYE